MNAFYPPATARDHNWSPEDLDALLRSFFQAEMPHPWPPLALPAERRQPSRGPLVRGRWLLAASLALLLGGTWFLSAKLGPGGIKPEPFSEHGAAARRQPTPPAAVRPADDFDAAPATGRWR
ncbi:MAG: hypothetical protein NZ700_04360 [Gemmataceae bacterium]|nr:hypothetical protein [Gemmataceae bacterium]MDW8264804.1 hypothetical protein [Gemmataceae bacterium]